MQLNPDAAFDCLFMAEHLGRDSGTFTRAELHLFGYLACLLWLYRRHTLSDWGYLFVGTELGAPYSLDIDNAVWELQERGYFTRSQNRMSISSVAQQQLQEFLSLSLNKERSECLYAACSSTSVFSAGMVVGAMSQEPELKRAVDVPSNRPLLEDAAQAQLYEQFDALRQALHNENIDLRVPSVAWLTALYSLQAPTEP